MKQTWKTISLGVLLTFGTSFTFLTAVPAAVSAAPAAASADTAASAKAETTKAADNTAADKHTDTAVADKHTDKTAADKAKAEKKQEDAAKVVDTAFEEHKEWMYPVVTVKNAEAGKKINAEVYNEVKRFVSEIRADEKKGGKVVSNVSYEVQCNRLGLLSLTMKEYRYAEHAANGTTYVKGMTFNTETGQLATAADLQQMAELVHMPDVYSPAELTKKLQAKAAKENIALLDSFQGLTKVPAEFYFDKKLHVHFLIQEMEAAPHAVGTIDLDADAE